MINVDLKPGRDSRRAGLIEYIGYIDFYSAYLMPQP